MLHQISYRYHQHFSLSDNLIHLTTQSHKIVCWQKPHYLMSAFSIGTNTYLLCKFFKSLFTAVDFSIPDVGKTRILFSRALIFLEKNCCHANLVVNFGFPLSLLVLVVLICYYTTFPTWYFGIYTKEAWERYLRHC